MRSCLFQKTWKCLITGIGSCVIIRLFSEFPRERYNWTCRWQSTIEFFPEVTSLINILLSCLCHVISHLDLKTQTREKKWTHSLKTCVFGLEGGFDHISLTFCGKCCQSADTELDLSDKECFALKRS